MYHYAKVSAETAKKLKLANIRIRVKDGDYILNETDLETLKGETPEDKVKAVAGKLLLEEEAKAELKHRYTGETNKVDNQTEEGGKQ